MSDPRSTHARPPPFMPVFRLALTAVIGGAAKVEELGRNYRAWLEQWLRLQRGLPSHDTLGRTAALPKPALHRVVPTPTRASWCGPYWT